MRRRGIYVGFGMALGIGNLLVELGGIPAVFLTLGGAGLPLGLLVWLTVAEPAPAPDRLGPKADAAADASAEAVSVSEGDDAGEEAVELAERESEQADSASAAGDSDYAGLPPAESSEALVAKPAEPARNTDAAVGGAQHHADALLATCKVFLRTPPLLVIVVAASLRNGGGYVFGYNASQYFQVRQPPAAPAIFPLLPTADACPNRPFQSELSVSRPIIAAWMSWTPAVVGTLGWAKRRALGPAHRGTARASPMRCTGLTAGGGARILCAGATGPPTPC